MSNFPFTIGLDNAQDALVATGTDFASATPIISTDNLVTGSGGIILPTDDDQSYIGDASRDTQQITLINQAGIDINVYLPSGDVRTVLKAGSSIRLEEPGDSGTWALVKLWG